MFLDGYHFVYGNFNSLNYGLIFAHCDSEYFSNLMGSVAPRTFFNKRNKTNYILSDDFTDSPISFEAEIFRDDFNSIPEADIRTIEKALFNKPNYISCGVDVQDVAPPGSTATELLILQHQMPYLQCRFMNPIRKEGDCGSTIGYKFTVECDSCMSWMMGGSSTFNLTGANNTVGVNVDTDIGGYTYPKVTIQTGAAGGDVTIVNQTDSSTRLTKFVGLSPNISLVLRGDINSVSGDNYVKFAVPNFVRFLDGANSISVTGNVTSIKFEWDERRFLT